jgi:hypothetical protein
VIYELENFHICGYNELINIFLIPWKNIEKVMGKLGGKRFKNLMKKKF